MSFERPKLESQLTAWLMRRTAPSGVRRVAPLGAAVATEVGEVRGENQDRVALARGKDSSGRAFAVAALADGIGGMRQGAQCAAMTLGSLIDAVARAAATAADPRQWLLHGIHQANNHVHAALRGEGGATLAAILVTGDGGHWASVGDSRVYAAKGSKLTQISTDDTIAGQLGRGHDAGFDQSKLIQFIGIGEALEVSVNDLAGDAGQTILLTTDGVHFLDSTPWFALLINQAADPGICVRRLAELSKWCGGPDNASAAMIGLDGSLSEGLPPIENCLEVWDAFGELQITMANPAPADLRSPDKTPSDGAAHPAAVVEPAPLAPKEKRKAAPRATQKKSRAPRKTKEAKGKPAEDSPAEPGAPQLRIEFPNKTG